ncbi:MAG: hypothetical protein WBY44_10175 [Bryobacteraceae bacterium]|jgi:hypothetical protein
MRLIPFAAFMSLMCALALSGQESPLSQPSLDPAATQTAAPPQDPPQSGQPKPPDPNATGTQPGNKPVDKRVFGVIPNNRTTSGTVPYQPISAKRKIVIGLKDSFDWPPFLTGALFAGLYQLEDSNPSFGQGTAGYFRRWGTASADQVIGNMFTEGFIPAAFHQDPRYFMLGPGGGTRKHRLWHAVNSIVVAPMDSGRKTFNFSEWGGNACAVAISNSYYPDTRDASDNVDKLLIAVATDTFSNVLKEFWPDVKNWWQRKHGHAPPPGVVAH